MSELESSDLAPNELPVNGPKNQTGSVRTFICYLDLPVAVVASLWTIKS